MKLPGRAKCLIGSSACAFRSTASVASNTVRCPAGDGVRSARMAEIMTTDDDRRRTGATGQPVRAVAGALTTTVACVLPVFLVGGLAVQIGDELGSPPPGSVWPWPCTSAPARWRRCPPGALVERYGGDRDRPRRRSASPPPACWPSPALAHSLRLADRAARRSAPPRTRSGSWPATRPRPPRAGPPAGPVVRRQAGRRSRCRTLLAGAAVPAVALTLGWRWAFVLAPAWRWPRRARPLVPAAANTAASRRGNGGDRATAALVVIGVGRDAGRRRGQRARHLPGRLDGGARARRPAWPG